MIVARTQRSDDSRIRSVQLGGEHCTTTRFSRTDPWTLVMLVASSIVFLDAVKVKSRVFLIVIGVFYRIFNIYSIYTRIFRDADQGIVLLKYTIQGNDYTFMKRSVKRAIFIQVMLFSITGIYTLFNDRKQELMIFATGHIYRETGTASKGSQYSKR